MAVTQLPIPESGQNQSAEGGSSDLPDIISSRISTAASTIDSTAAQIPSALNKDGAPIQGDERASMSRVERWLAAGHYVIDEYLGPADDVHCKGEDGAELMRQCAQVIIRDGWHGLFNSQAQRDRNGVLRRHEFNGR